MPSRATSDLQFWNALAMGFFILLAEAAFWLIRSFGEIASIDFLDVAVLALATFRLSHLFTNDKIFDFARVMLFDRSGKRLARSERGWRRVLCEVMECLWCAGLWSSLIVIMLYAFRPAGRLAVTVLAIAGAAAFMSILTKAIAARAEPGSRG